METNPRAISKGRRSRALPGGRLSTARRTPEPPRAQPAPRTLEQCRRSQGGGTWGNQGFPREASVATLVPDDLDDPAPVALAVELEEEHALPRAEAELTVSNRNRLAGRTEEHRHAVGVAVPGGHVLLADVLGATIPIIVRVVLVARDEVLEQCREVLEEPVLELVHADAAGRMRRVDADDPVAHAALLDRLGDLVGDVPHGETSGRPEPSLVLEDLHRPPMLAPVALECSAEPTALEPTFCRAGKT